MLTTLRRGTLVVRGKEAFETTADYAASVTRSFWLIVVVATKVSIAGDSRFDLFSVMRLGSVMKPATLRDSFLTIVVV